MTWVVVVAQLGVAGALAGFGLWGRGMTPARIHLLGPADERERRALACRRGARACLVAATLVALASVVTTTQLVT